MKKTLVRKKRPTKHETLRSEYRFDYSKSEEIEFKSIRADGLIGARPWRTALFQGYGPDFRRRQQNLADFRIDVRPGTDLAVRNVSVVSVPS